MANGRSESEVFVLRSGPRSGLKREFAFALQSHSQFSASFGRTRSGKKRLRVVAASPKAPAKRKRSSAETFAVSDCAGAKQDAHEGGSENAESSTETDTAGSLMETPSSDGKDFASEGLLDDGIDATCSSKKQHCVADETMCTVSQVQISPHGNHSSSEAVSVKTGHHKPEFKKHAERELIVAGTDRIGRCSETSNSFQHVVGEQVVAGVDCGLHISDEPVSLSKNHVEGQEVLFSNDGAEDDRTFRQLLPENQTETSTSAHFVSAGEDDYKILSLLSESARNEMIASRKGEADTEANRGAFAARIDQTKCTGELQSKQEYTSNEIVASAVRRLANGRNVSVSASFFKKHAAGETFAEDIRTVEVGYPTQVPSANINARAEKLAYEVVSEDICKVIDDCKVQISLPEIPGKSKMIAVYARRTEEDGKISSWSLENAGATREGSETDSVNGVSRPEWNMRQVHSGMCYSRIEEGAENSNGIVPDKLKLRGLVENSTERPASVCRECNFGQPNYRAHSSTQEMPTAASDVPSRRFTRSMLKEQQKQAGIISISNGGLDVVSVPESSSVIQDREMEPVDEVITANEKREVKHVDQVNNTTEVIENHETKPLDQVNTREVNENREMKPQDQVNTREVTENRDMKPQDHVNTPEVTENRDMKPQDHVNTPEVTENREMEPQDHVNTPELTENREMKALDEVTSTASQRNLELKMSKKIVPNKFPSNIKELLATGLLEGLAVKYIGSYKCSEGLRGTIQGCGILCTCDCCRGTQVISAFQFERHAGSLKKRSAEYIFLENGRTIRDIINACRSAPIEILEATIQSAISSAPIKRTKICRICKDPFDPLEAGTSLSICTPCLELKKSETNTGYTCKAAAEFPIPVSEEKSTGNMMCTGFLPKKSGRVTKKDLGLHKLVFSEDGLPDGTELAYYSRGQRLIEGYKKGIGIFCRCCNTVISPSQFEAHAGWASRRKPYLNIYTSNGVSLHELSISLSKGRKNSTIHNDDLCSICFDGGNLLLCDLCPRAFHADCAGLSTIPTGQWYCRYCWNMMQKERFVEHNVNAIAAGRISGVDPLDQICKRSIRIVEIKAPVSDASSCVLCRLPDFSKSGFGPRTVILCDQCEKEYHVSCLKDHNMADLKELPKGEWFCCADCSRIHSALQTLVLCGAEGLSQSLLDVIKRKHEEKGLPVNAHHDVRWKLLKGKSASRETKILLSQAVGIFHDCFDPIIDSVTGRDLIPSMVYGRTMRYQDFGGMYCVMLTMNSSVVSAGILRVFGQDAAELPLVATGLENQGRGYFQVLFSCIERLLSQLRVKNLVLPAADEAESIWKNKFGFKEMVKSQLCPFTEPRLMRFMGTSMLHKEVLQLNHFDENS